MSRRSLMAQYERDAEQALSCGNHVAHSRLVNEWLVLATNEEIDNAPECIWSAYAETE